jgi:hypothetical protein
VDEARPGGGRRLRHGLRAVRLHGRERLGAARLQDADEVDDRPGAAHRARHLVATAQVRRHRLHLADHAEDLRRPRRVRVPHGDADPVVALGEGVHDVFAEKPRAAEHGHELERACRVRHAKFSVREAAPSYGLSPRRGIAIAGRAAREPAWRERRRAVDAPGLRR